MGKTVVHGNFEWDEEKNKANIENHGMSFEEILPMFDDPLFWEQYDSEHSKLDETRYFGTAKINGFAVVVSSYTERERTRIISARISTPQEEKRYEEWCKQFYS
uniref:BrnT family toxin n=1 Tax=uncultured prokaryote TaxID=198431 RepID=A0A0H5PVG7_9ZZZZ|nr:unnamed protein product [uncultured bacterium]CRY93746.1 hypothetical protein [uncultured prokaryote]